MNYIICDICQQERIWYNFPSLKGKITNNTCFECLRKIELQKARSKLYILIMAADKNKMVDLRNHLFDCLGMVKTKQMNPEEAKAICMIAQTIINSAKVEIDFIKAIGGKKESDFFQIENKQGSEL